MRLGIFSNVYPDTDPAQLFYLVRQDGLTDLQLNLLSVWGEMLPPSLDEGALSRLVPLARVGNLRLVSLAGTFNMIAPDSEERAEGLRRFGLLCRAASLLEIPVITLCTGSRNPHSRWLWHEDNSSPAAWRDLLSMTESLLVLAERFGVVLGVEPEPSNVVCDPAHARTYLDEFRSPRLKIILDGANLFRPALLPQMDRVLEESIALLAPDIIQAHAKDFTLTADGVLSFTAAGKGLLDYPRYLSLLDRYGFTGTLLLHALEPVEVAGCVGFLRGLLHA